MLTRRSFSLTIGRLARPSKPGCISTEGISMAFNCGLRSHSCPRIHCSTRLCGQQDQGGQEEEAEKGVATLNSPWVPNLGRTAIRLRMNPNFRTTYENGIMGERLMFDSPARGNMENVFLYFPPRSVSRKYFSQVLVHDQSDSAKY